MKTKEMTRVAMYTALTCAVAVLFRYAPPGLVPFSILPLIVLLSGFVLGPRSGAWSMALYVIIGLVGFEVFATAPFGGITYVLKPTFGYLLGYILAAWVVGSIVKQNPGLIRSVVAVLAGIVSIYVVGLVYIYIIVNFYLHQPTAVMQVISIGFLPFIVLDLVKGAVTVIIGPILNRSLVAAGALAE